MIDHDPGCIPRVNTKQHAEGTHKLFKMLRQEDEEIWVGTPRHFLAGSNWGTRSPRKFEILQAPGEFYKQFSAISAWNFLIKYTKYFLDYTPARQRLRQSAEHFWSPCRRSLCLVFILRVLIIFRFRFSFYVFPKRFSRCFVILHVRIREN